jgi:hypothetical protein
MIRLVAEADRIMRTQLRTDSVNSALKEAMHASALLLRQHWRVTAKRRGLGLVLHHCVLDRHQNDRLDSKFVVSHVEGIYTPVTR